MYLNVVFNVILLLSFLLAAASIFTGDAQYSICNSNSSPPGGNGTPLKLKQILIWYYYIPALINLDNSHLKLIQ